MTCSDDTFDVTTGSGTGPHTMDNCARKGGKGREVGVDVDRVEVARNLGIWFVRKRGGEDSATFAGGHRIALITEGNRETLRCSVTLEISEDGVALAVLLLEIYVANLNEFLELVAHEDITRD